MNSQTQAEPIAGFVRRLAAMLYDGLLLIALIMLATALITLPLGMPSDAWLIVYQVFLFEIIPLVFFCGFWINGGQTLGMRAWRLRIVDRNAVSVGGRTERTMALEPLKAKWEAFGWQVREVDGHDLRALLELAASLPPVDSETPTAVIAHTVAGKGVSRMEGAFEWHLGYLAPHDAEDALRELGRRGNA